LAAVVDGEGRALERAEPGAQAGARARQRARRARAEGVLVAVRRIGVADDLAAAVDGVGVAVGVAGQDAQVGARVRKRPGRARAEGALLLVDAPSPQRIGVADDLTARVDAVGLVVGAAGQRA